jgi:hypothetical protein
MVYPDIRRPSSTAITVGVVAMVGFALRIGLLARSLSYIDRRFIPDDTYYTLTVARSFAHGHGPTVDGSTLTSGFQPLQAFVMTPVFWITDNVDAALRVNLFVMIVADTAAIVVLAWVAYRLAGNVAAIVAAALWALSPTAVSMALGGLETSLALLFEIGVVAAVIWCNDAPSRGRWIVVGIVAGLAALARIDALILVGLLIVVQLWRAPRREMWIAAASAAAVVAPWWIWCWVNLGTPFPTSGAAAHRLLPYASFSRFTQSLAAGAVSGGPLGQWDWLRARLIEHPGWGVAALWIAVAGSLALTVWFLRCGRLEQPWTFAAALPAFSACLLVFYAWYGVTFYFTRYLSPAALTLSLVVAVGVARLAALPARGRNTAWAVAGIVGLVVAVAVVRSHARDLTRSEWRSASLSSPRAYDAGCGYRAVMEKLRKYLPEGGTVGGWQSGALGYYAPDDVTVVNLDGVVNPDAVEADEHGRVGEYMRERNITLIADFPFAASDLAQQAQRVDPRVTTRTLAEIPAADGSPRYLVIAIDWP